jgi:hypothetical protein
MEEKRIKIEKTGIDLAQHYERINDHISEVCPG